MSDIWSVILENRIAPVSIWQSGDIIHINKECEREFKNTYNPNAKHSIADTYFGQFYNDNSNEYARSGVFSHWFYILVEGESGTNELGNYYDVQGIGMDAAEDLVFNAVFNGYLNNVINYNQLRTQMSAAAAIFGDNSYQEIQIENAWYAVGVGSESTSVSLSTSGSICASGSTVTASNCPAGSTISWTTSSNLVVQSGGTTNTPVIKAINSSVSGPGTVQIHFTSNGYTSPGPVLDVWVGKPGIPTTNPSGYPTIQLNSGELLSVSLSETPGASPSSGYWSCSGSLTRIGAATGSSTMFEATGTGIGNFYVTTTNACDTSNVGGGTVNVSGGGPGPGPLMVYPNPATDSFEIQLDDAVVSADQEEVESELRIYDQFNSLKEIVKFKGKKHKIILINLQKVFI